MFSSQKHITTTDGSSTLYLPWWDETYHSRHGAVQESRHVFIEKGLHVLGKTDIRLLEMGFGTGLNAYMTLLESEKHNLNITYETVEAYPVGMAVVETLNYPEQLDAPRPLFEELHRISWGEKHGITPGFTLLKRKQKFETVTDTETFDLIYFDAFGARVQPELWTTDIFQRMYRALHPGGILVTYAAKGSVRRAMNQVGFTVARLPGPPGKREMLRSSKP